VAAGPARSSRDWRGHRHRRGWTWQPRVTPGPTRWLRARDPPPRRQ